MKISNVNIFSQKTFLKPGFRAQNAYFNTPAFDTVTFSGKTEAKSQDKKDNAALALELGKELYQTSETGPHPINLKKIQKMARKYDPRFTVEHPQNLGQKSGMDQESLRATAVTMPKRNKDGSLKQVTFFIDEIGKENANKQIAIATHEFTHGFQELDGDIFNIAFEAAGQNAEKAEVLMHFACKVFHAIETEIADDFAQSAENYRNMDNLTKEDIFEAFGCENQDEFNKMVRKIFNADASVAIESCRRFPMWDKIALKDDPVALKRFVKKDCTTQAKNELEAYRAQKQMLEYMGEPVGKIGAAVAIYEALSEAFE